jgi:hypothetical protein
MRLRQRVSDTPSNSSRCWTNSSPRGYISFRKIISRRENHKTKFAGNPFRIPDSSKFHRRRPPFPDSQSIAREFFTTAKKKAN